MYKNMNENIEIYFICYKKKEMALVETYYDEILNIHYWYFNAWRAYKLWQKKFKKTNLSNLSKQLLVIAASRYLIYLIENNKYKNIKEYQKIANELNSIDKELKLIIEDDTILKKL